MKHLEIVFVEASASLSTSFSFAGHTGDMDVLRTDGADSDGLLTAEGTNEFVSGAQKS